MGAPAPTQPKKPPGQKGATAPSPAAKSSPATAPPPAEVSSPAAVPSAAAEPSLAAATTREAVLARLLRLGEATASHLALQLAVSVQIMRRHLRSLEEEGLVEASPTTEGPGRPSNRWRLTEAGQGRFTDGSSDFALGLLHSLANRLSPAQVEELLQQQAEEKARGYRRRIGGGTLQERLDCLVELRRHEGFVAELRPDPQATDAWIISEFHCSVMRIAEEFPVVCDQELQLIRRTFPDCQVERVHWRLEEGHSCGFRLRPALDPA